MSNRITLKDVAARAGVSYQTVSKVINGQASVAEETEELIWQIVRDLGYRTNVIARSLRKNASGLIGYSWTPEPPDQANPILDQFLSSAVTSAEAAGYHLMLFPNGNLPDHTAAYRSLISAGRVDGFIITSTNYNDPRIQLLQEMNFPFVAFGRSNPEWSFAYVDVDGETGVALAVQHLIEQGHRQIALLAWPDDSRVGTARVNGYLRGMAEGGLPVDCRWLQRGNGDAATGVRLTQELLALPEAIRPTAVVAIDDRLAIGAIQAAQAAGLQVGAQFAVTGFDDTPGLQHFNPPLTSLRQPVWAIGQKIVTLLIALMQGHTPAETQVILPPRLIVRSSSLRK